MNIGRNILELRKQKNITQEDLAAELGVTAAAVSKWENNYTLPDILMLCALADYFAVTTDELLGRHTEPKYAVILTENHTLGKRIEALAVQHGFHITGIFTDPYEATTSALEEENTQYILAGMYRGGLFDDSPLQKLVSVSPTDDEIIEGFKWVLQGYDTGNHGH